MPELKEMLTLRVLSIDRSPKIVNVFKPPSKRDRPTSVLQFHDLRDMNPNLRTDMERPISEADVEFLSHDGLIHENDYETIKFDSESLKKVPPGLSDSFERGLAEPSPEVPSVEKE